MKKIKSIAAIACLLITSVCFAQNGRIEDKKEKIEAMKIGFLTKRLDLTTEEAKNFWPVYNKYQDELDAIRKSRKKKVRDTKQDFAAMSDKDVEKVVDNEIVSRQSELDVMKKFHGQFKQVLPIKKVAILYKTEDDFKRELLQKIQERMREKRGGNND